MKYNEFIHINEEFNPVYDLENELDNGWKLFIPNDKFREVLTSVIDAFDTNKQKSPVWLQGTYGTGKSHATSVIKHLLCDENINNFDLEESQIIAKLDNFRNNNKVFPVVLKGTSTIGSPEKFRITIQKAVTDALKDKNMRVTVPSDFEHIISLLEEKTIILQEKDIEGTIIEAYGLENIESLLKEQESDILIAVEDILEKKGIGSIQKDIVGWLTEIRNELNKEYGIDYLMIFWDEFTGALTQSNVEDTLLELQNIAEAKNNGISLFIVSHRTRSNQIDLNEEKMEKIMDRFKRINYTMEPIATYELMERSIDKDEEWEEVKNRFTSKINEIVERIGKNDGPKAKKALENLYPIHPYTAYLATFIAQEIGSTERSIFRFLHDNNENGFKSFIDAYEINERFFLTAEYLWDFFYEDFDEKEDERISSAIQKYKLHYEKLDSEGEEYLTIFKVVLLLNILYKTVEVNKDSLVIPSRNNINEAFIGSIYEDKVDYVLDYMDKQSVINESPDHYFELTTNTLNPAEVKKEEDKIRKSLNLKTILKDNDLKDIKNNINKKSTREIEIEIKEGNIQKNRLISDLEKGIFEHPGYLHVLLFLSKDEKELMAIEEVIKSVEKEGLLDNIIVVIPESSFRRKNLDKFITFKAQAEVAKKHHYAEDQRVFTESANKLVNDWVTSIKTGITTWYSNKNEGRTTLGEFTSTINNKLSKSIFKNGLENIKGANVKTIWPAKNAKIQAEKYITSTNIDQIKSNANSKRTLPILKDNEGELIVNHNLKLKEDISKTHPIKLMSDFVDEQMKKAQKKGQFNLGEELRPLSNVPYGLYPNDINIAALGFIMRKYVNKLYDEKGNSIDKSQMKDKVMHIFEYWTKNKKGEKLLVRFGTEEEKELIKLLNDIFNLNIDSDEQSIQNIRWSIRKWIKERKTPLWLFRHLDNINDANLKTLESLEELLRPDDNNIPDNIIQKCYRDIYDNKYDFNYLINNTDTDKLLKDYILSINNTIKEENLTDIINHIVKVLPEEIYDWDENIVSGKVKDWLLEQIPTEVPKPSEPSKPTSGKPITETEPPKPISGKPITETEPPKPISGKPITETEPNEIIEKVRAKKPETMVDIVVKVLEKHEDVRRTFEPYL